MTLRTSILSSVLIVLGATAAYGQSRPASAATCDLPYAPGVSSQQLVSGERQRAYRLFVPPGYDGRQRLPLVLDLHGSGGNAAAQAGNSGFETLSASERFFVATLEGEGNRWNVPVRDGRADDVKYVSDVIAHIAARVCTDEARIYATGFSGGGRMTSLLACKLGSRLAAVAPVSGLRWPGPCDGRSVPVLYSGAHTVYTGLDQVNLDIPSALHGSISIACTAGDQVSNAVTVNVQ